MTDALEQLNLALEVAQELGRQLAANDRLDRHGRRRVTGLRIRESGLRRGDTYESIPSIDGRERASADLLSDFVRSDLVARLGIHPRASSTEAGACSGRHVDAPRRLSMREARSGGQSIGQCESLNSVHRLRDRGDSACWPMQKQQVTRIACRRRQQARRWLARYRAGERARFRPYL